MDHEVLEAEDHHANDSDANFRSESSLFLRNEYVFGAAILFLLFANKAETDALGGLADDVTDGNSCETACSRGKDEHQTDHCAGKVDSKHTIHCKKQFTVGDLMHKTVVEAHWHKVHD